MPELVLGKHLGEAVGRFGAGGQVVVVRRPALAQQPIGVLDISAQPELAGDLPGNGQVVAGHHLDLMPCAWAWAMVSAESSRGGSNSGRMPMNCHGPSSPRCAPPRGCAGLSAASPSTTTCRPFARLPIEAGQIHDHLGCALGHLELVAVLCR
jgi:hypothetical protein